MAQSTLDRKTRFRMALALEQKSDAQWARENELSPGHLSLFLSGARDSEKLAQRIEHYIAQTFRAHKVRAA